MPTDLLARLRAATGPDRELAYEVLTSLVARDENGARIWCLHHGDPTASVDSCLELIRRTLPRHGVALAKYRDCHHAWVCSEQTYDDANPGHGSVTLALALLTAIVAAVEAQRSS